MAGGLVCGREGQGLEGLGGVRRVAERPWGGGESNLPSVEVQVRDGSSFTGAERLGSASGSSVLKSAFHHLLAA